MLKLLLNEFYINRHRQEFPAKHASLLSGALAACGGGGASENFSAFPKNYLPPNPSFDSSILPDSYYHILRPAYREPCWVKSLTMDMHEAVVPPMLEEYSRTVAFAFPKEQPGYDQFGITGWTPATEQIKIATREI